MDFSWTEEQLKYKQAVIEFAQRELNDGLIDRDRQGELSRENWKKCARMGILGLATPEGHPARLMEEDEEREPASNRDGRLEGLA